MNHAKSITVITDMIPKIKLHLHQLRKEEMGRFLNVSDEESEKMQFEPEYYHLNTFVVTIPEKMVNMMMTVAMNRDMKAITDPSALNYSLTVVCMEELLKFIISHVNSPFEQNDHINYETELVRNVAVGDVMEMLIDGQTVYYMYDNQSDFIGLNGVKSS